MDTYDKVINEVNKSEKRAKKIEDVVKVCIRIPRKTLIALKRNKLDAEEHNKFLSVQDQIIEALDEYLKKK